MWKHLKVIGVVFGAAGLAWGGDIFKARKLREFCHLPSYNYQQDRTKNPVSTVSLTAIAGANVSAEILKVGAPKPESKILRVKQFQMSQTELRLDHCSLTKIAIVLVEDGTWTVTAVAEQNPYSVDSTQQPKFVELKRNGFHIRLRGVGLATPLDQPDTAVLGKPEYCNIAIPCFWVERGQKKPLRDGNRNDEIQRYFDLIDRVEVDLSYE
ncbi:hypothetical protein GC163_01220 [bacterium]|nr:hypothetical protein [bacterium]